MTLKAVHVIGGGLAGSGAAGQLAQAGVPVVLHEMRPQRLTAAHKTNGYAELVCSNSFRSDDKVHNAVGLLHAEMRRLGSLVMRAADSHQVPAGGALAVDRDGFSAAVSAALAAQPLITLVRGEVVLPPDDWDSVIIATGPLTSPDLATTIRALTGEDALAFFDAIAPIVHRDSIDLEQARFHSRYDTPRPGRSAPARRKGLCGRTAPSGQQIGDAIQHGRLPDQAETRRAGAHLPQHSGPAERGICAARRLASQYIPQFAPAARRHAAAESQSALAFRRPDHRLRGLRGIRRHRPDRRALCRRRAPRRSAERPAADHGPWRAARPYHRRPYRDHRCRAVVVPADEREFRPVPADRGTRRPRGPQVRPRLGQELGA